MSRRTPSKPGPGSYRVLGWVARLGVAGTDAASAALGLGRSTTYSHVARLESAGLLLRVPAYDAAGGVVVVTAAGAREAEETGAAAAVVPTVREASTARHGRAVSWVAASVDVRGWEWVGPAELREQPGWRLKREDGARHAPDLGILRDGKRIAVEVELHVKAPARLRDILRGYRRLIGSGELDAVSYVVDSRRVAALLERQVNEARLAEAVSIGSLDAIVRGTRERRRATSGNSLSRPASSAAYPS